MNPDPAQLGALMAQLGGGQPGGEAPMPQPEAPEGDWLVTAINAVHDGMVKESDPKQVSLLGSILDKLTTFQATAFAPKGSGSQ